jgi:hypothetical protein
MARDTESAAYQISVTPLRYRDAAWEAYEHGDAPPDASLLPDEVLREFMVHRYNDTRFLLPRAACQVVEAEWERRGMSRRLVDELLAFAAVALPALSGFVIGCVLLFH